MKIFKSPFFNVIFLANNNLKQIFNKFVQTPNLVGIKTTFMSFQFYQNYFCIQLLRLHYFSQNIHS